jgi:hypothetical protein
MAGAFLFSLSPAHAQTVASLSMSGSIIEYEGFLTSGAAVLAPALRYDQRDVSFATQGSWTIFESGNGIFQATAAAGWLAPSKERWRWEVSGAGGAYRYAEAAGTGHLLGRTRLHFFAERTGGWFGVTTGATFTHTVDVPVELAFGAWRVHDNVALLGTITGAFLRNEHHVDIAGAAKWSGRRLQLEVRAGARPWTNLEGAARAGVWAELSALVPIGGSIALEFSGGTYPSDPVRRVLGANYAAAGLRFTLAGRNETPVLTIPPALVTAVREHMKSGSSAETRLEVIPSGTLQTVRIHVANAATVELMSDFTDWKTVSLGQVAPGVWEIKLPIEEGVHRLNIRINGGAWLVPAGARPEQGEFGDVVGVIVIR